MAIHVTFSMINSLVHSFCKCLCALWEILKQRKTQTKKYHDKYKPNYHPYKNASTQLPHSMLLAGELREKMFPAVNQTAHARSFQPRYQEEAHRWTHLSQKLLFWRQFIFTHDSRDLLFYFQKNIFNNIEENELFLLDIFFLKRVLSWHVSWETIWQVLLLKIVWFLFAHE